MYIPSISSIVAFLKRTTLCCGFILLLQFTSFAQSSSADFDRVSNLCRQLLLSDTAYATEQSYRVTDDVIYDKDALGYFKSLTPEGKWDDLQYTGQLRSAWRASWHLYRTMLICRLYYQTHEAKYLQAVHAALAYWIKNDFKAENWWQNNINTPFTYSSLMIMLGKDTLPAEMKFYNEVLVKRIPIANATGQNLLWQLDNEARAAILHKDAAAFSNSMRRMQTVIEVTTKEGIQPDYSFHQHGAMLQFGNYGLHFVNTLLFWMSIAEHSPFAFAADKKQILADYCSQGLRWSIYKRGMDVTAVGRQLRNNYTLKRGDVLFANFNLLQSLGKGNFCLNGFADDKACVPAGNKAFWRSDYMVDMQPNSMISVKMHDPYVAKVESINSENMKGAFLNDGVCLIQRTGKEYLNIEPLWNWTMLPGITCDTTLNPADPKTFGTKNTAVFTGMASDSSCGVAVMQYSRLNVHANKSYFFINNMVVALGAGIDTGRNIITTINQRYTNNRSFVNGEAGKTKWLWHDSIAYLFPGKGAIHTNVSYKTGNWKAIDGASDKDVTDSVMSICVDHRTADHYAYIIKPNVSLKETRELSGHLPVTVIANTKELQAIQAGAIVQAVFYSAGELMLSSKQVLKVSSMVLQRNMKIPVWGWAAPGETVKVSFNAKEYTATAQQDGKWMVKMNALPAGGPYDMTVQSGAKSLSVKNILIGDVWICSGQSNMQFDFNGVKQKYAAEIAASENKNIRIITIARTYGITPQDDCRSDRWKTASPQSIISFSAAGYFFGKELNEKYKVPIGLIATNYGGTPAEAWTSEEGLQAFPQFADGIKYLHDTVAVNKKMQASRNAVAAWHVRTKSDDSGYVNNNAAWADVTYNDQQWKPVTLPALWDNYGYKNTFGVFWFRKEIDVPASVAGKAGVIKLGSVDDEDETFINGVRVGGYANRTKPREHTIPANVLKAGKNIIAVRVINWDNAGGFGGDDPMVLEAGGQTLPINGAWKYKIGLKLPQRPGTYQPTSVPTALFNSMIHPLIPFAIKGVIWYQGEGNADRADEYATLFPNMITDWRRQWGEGDFPFIYQQLVNFRSVVPNPSQSDWAELREAQTKTLAVPNTAMAVGIDIGDAITIHPLNKKDVGHRLALGAEKIAYGEKSLVYAGPLYKSMKKDGNKIILSFTNTGGGLIANDGKPLAQFAIAGEDKKFVWANAVIKGNTIEVSSDAVTNPVAVRYAWADNPEGSNLYNKEGLPASPFRTDNWPGVTTGKKFVFK